MRSEQVIASSWRALVLPPCPRHSISTLDEICGRFLPSRSRQCFLRGRAEHEIGICEIGGLPTLGSEGMPPDYTPRFCWWGMW
jgi:hypothetical protein